MEIVFAGFGGQGVLTSGLIVAEMALEEGKNVTWMPAYGPTMRGGKAYSVVKYMDGVIGGPDMEEIDILVAMNGPSLEYTELLKDGGLLVVNSDAISDDEEIHLNADVVRVPCLTLAKEVSNPKGANIVAIGALLKRSGIFDFETAKEVMTGYFEEKGKGKYTEANEAALKKGWESV
ncbi:MAG: 2-oxoacid:acceptor oxidoreductase family protein [Clostridiales Family XIII bacterium]|jgi:2-oxoglutarate ferredoxin oxidoreductase subunit gamma|nr:2-oxoacid:acceptor oxidoreductase family protein [Clostridiales Family XIII bacterium]